MSPQAHARVTQTADQMSAPLDGETAILGLRSGVYYGVNAVGSKVWALLAAPRTVDEIVHALSSEYSVPASRIRDDVVGFVEDLVREGLAATSGEDAG